MLAIVFELLTVQHQRRIPCASRKGARRRTRRYAEHHRDPGVAVNRRLLRAVGSIALCLAAMVVVAYAFGHVTRTEWVWWLAPLTVAVDGSLPFRGRGRGGAAVLSPLELPIFRDLGVPLYLVSSGVATALVAWSAYTGNRLALIIGAAFAILGREHERGEEPTFERDNEPA